MIKNVFTAGSEYIPVIRREIEAIGAKPEAVAQMLDAKEALLLVVPDGFMVLETDRDGALFIWLAYGSGKESTARYLPMLEDMARLAGAGAIRCISKRRGFSRMGWTTIGEFDGQIIFERKVPGAGQPA